MKKEIIKSQKELKIISKNNKEIVTKAKYGPSKRTKIPLSLNEDLSFLVAAIIGDGHIKKSKFQIRIELSNFNLIKHLKKICKTLFNREFNIYPVKIREGKKQTFSMGMDSKSICKLLEETFEIPRGKKSHIVKVPKYIMNSNKKNKIAFLQGIMATEGGSRRRGFGLSTASKQLWKDLKILFENINIPVSMDKWKHKTYKKIYYGLTFKKEYMKQLEWVCRSGQAEN